MWGPLPPALHRDCAGQEVRERRNQLRHPPYQKPELLAALRHNRDGNINKQLLYTAHLVPGFRITRDLLTIRIE